jgi:hypothetical protein
LDQGLFDEESESDEEENTEFSKLFVHDAAIEAPDPLLLPERRSVLFCINAALRCFGVDSKHLIRYKDLERPSHRGLSYVGSWEDRTTGLTFFARLSRFF